MCASIDTLKKQYHQTIVNFWSLDDYNINDIENMRL
jgi:hypothetical protein